MAEKHFLDWILDVAARFGWVCWHVPTPMRPVGGGRFVPDARGAGLPDLVMLHADPARLIFAEVKDHDGRLSERQLEFLRLARAVGDAIRAASVDATAPVGVYTWRPGNEDLIETVLRGKVML